MKKNKYLLIVLITILLLTPQKIDALSVGDTVKTTEYGLGTEGSPMRYATAGIRLGGGDIFHFTYNGTDNKTGQKLDLICVNPGLESDPINAEVTSELDPNNKKQYGLIWMLSQTNPSDFGLDSSDQLTGAMSTAAKVYWNYDMGGMSMSTGWGEKKGPPIYNTGEYWSTGHITGVLKSNGRMDYSKMTASSGDSLKILNAAEQIYKEGKKQAEIGYTSSDSEVIPKVNISKVKEETQKETTPSEESEESTMMTSKSIKTVYLEVNLTDFANELKEFKFTGVENSGTTTVEVVGVSFSKDFDTSKYNTPLEMNANLFEKFADQVKTENDLNSLKFYVAVKMTASMEYNEEDYEEEKEVDCGNGAKLNYSYKTPVNTRKVYVLSGGYNRHQDYLVVQDFLTTTTNTSNVSSSGSFELEALKCKITTEPCDYTVCEGNDCNSSFPKVCRDSSVPNERGNVVYKFLESFNKEKNEYNIKKCVLKSQKDIAGNSYRLNDPDHAAAVTDNPYCQIMCKEDYTLEVPYKKQVGGGRYFSLDVSLTGQQDCYSTKLDIDTFHTDARGKIKEVVEAYNKWARYYELVNNNLVYDPEVMECSITNCEEFSGEHKIGENEIEVEVEVEVENEDGTTTTKTETQTQTEDITISVLEGCRDSGNPTIKRENKKRVEFGSLTYYSYDEATGTASPNGTIPSPVSYGRVESLPGSCTTSYLGRTSSLRNNTSYYLTSANLKLEITSLSDYNVTFKVSNSSPMEKDLSGIKIYFYDKHGDAVIDYVQLSGTIGKATTAASATREFTFSKSSDAEYFSVSTNPYCSTEGGSCKITTPEEDRASHMDEYKRSLEEAATELTEAIDEFKAIIDQFNSCTGDEGYKSVSDSFDGYWKMVYQFDPKISYSYDEPVPNDRTIDKWIEIVSRMSCEDGNCDVMYPTYKKVQAEECEDENDESCEKIAADGKITSPFLETEVNVNEFCFGDINNDYSCKNESKNKLTEADYNLETYFMCDFDSDSKKFVCDHNKQYPVTKVNYVHKVAVGEGNYTTRRVYYTGTAAGDIRIEAEDFTKENYQAVPGLPVGYNTPKGTYFYIISLSNIGRYFDGGGLGRILSGDSKSIMSFMNNPEDQNTVQYSHDTQKPSKTINVNEYACSYAVSENSCYNETTEEWFTEDKCEYGEGGKDKTWEDCQKRLCYNSDDDSHKYCIKGAEAYYSCPTKKFDKDACTKYNSREEAVNASKENLSCCPNCKIECINCLIPIGGPEDTYQPNEVQYDFRTITPANMNPNSRKLGYNWDSQNGSNSLIAQKAGNTISEIEARARNVNTGSSVGVVSDYALKVKMTPDMVNWIKKYNNDNIENGNYNNSSLECYDYTLSDYTDKDSCEEKGYIWDNDKCIMAKVFCYSKFIDDLSASFTSDVDAPNRDKAKSVAHENYTTYQGLSSLPNQDDIITVNDYWTIYKYSTLDVNGDGIPDIGPSWK